MNTECLFSFCVCVLLNLFNQCFYKIHYRALSLIWLNLSPGVFLYLLWKGLFSQILFKITPCWHIIMVLMLCVKFVYGNFGEFIFISCNFHGGIFGGLCIQDHVFYKQRQFNFLFYKLFLIYFFHLPDFSGFHFQHNAE
jgi:hypothetical protein